MIEPDFNVLPVQNLPNIELKIHEDPHRQISLYIPEKADPPCFAPSDNTGDREISVIDQ